jgi:hypothetical protein
MVVFMARRTRVAKIGKRIRLEARRHSSAKKKRAVRAKFPRANNLIPRLVSDDLRTGTTI